MADPKKEKQTDKAPATPPPPRRQRMLVKPPVDSAAKPAGRPTDKLPPPAPKTKPAPQKAGTVSASANKKAEAVAGAAPTPAAQPAVPAKNPDRPPAQKSPPSTNPPEKRKPKPKADSEQARLKKEEQQRRARRRNRQFIGLAITILVIVGAVSIVMNGINMTREILDDTGEMKEHEKRFKSFVWFDVLPFESIAQVDENTIKQVIIWSVFDDQMDTLTRDELDQAQIPASEVDRYGAELFGPEFRFSGHRYFEDLEHQLKYTYNAETMMYSVPNTGLNPNYLPTVVEVVREPGGVRRVVVGYVSTRNSENQVIATPDYEHPVRYVDYMMRRDGGNYYLYAVQRNETHAMAEVASQATSVSIPPPLSLPDESVSVAPASATSGADADGDASADVSDGSTSAEEDSSTA